MAQQRFPIGWKSCVAVTNVLVVVVAVAIGIRWSLLSQPCRDDPLVAVRIPSFLNHNNHNQETTESLETFVKIPPCHVFSESYFEARTKFRRAVQGLGLSVETLSVVPHQDYTMDIVVLPGQGPGLVLHTSGVHGVEGFAGSAIQLALLYQLQQQQQQALPQWQSPPNMPTVILVHAVNPFGMATYRRSNEHNVDLNRNGLTDAELQDLKSSHVNHGPYQRLDAVLNPRFQSQRALYGYAYGTSWLMSLYCLVKEGYHATKAAMVGGQYYQEQGIFYGGRNTRERSVRLLEEWLKQYLTTTTHGVVAAGTNKEDPSESSTPTTVPTISTTWIDVHTGLGPSGVDSLIFNPQSRSSCSTTKHNQNRTMEMLHWFPNSTLSPSADNVSAVSKGYEHTKGVLLDYYEQTLCGSDNNDTQRKIAPLDVLMVVQEFGTVPSSLVGNALMVENAAYFSATLNQPDKLTWAKRTTGRAFYPQSMAWRRAILQRGWDVLVQAMQRSAADTQHDTHSRQTDSQQEHR